MISGAAFIRIFSSRCHHSCGVNLRAVYNQGNTVDLLCVQQLLHISTLCVAGVMGWHCGWNGYHFLIVDRSHIATGSLDKV